MIEQLIAPVTSLLDKFIADKDQKAKLAHEVATMAQKHAHTLATAQIEVNKTEAQHRSIFVAGWRPFVGWVCGLAFAWHFILSPIVLLSAGYFGVAPPDLPEFNMTALLTVLGGILGIGGLRTYEKQKGLTH